MHPRLITIGNFSIQSYGTMLVVAFVIGSWLQAREMKRKGLNPDMGGDITFLAVLFGVLGSKITAILEDWHNLMIDPGSTIANSGLTWHGGFILATLVVAFYCRVKKIPLLKLADADAPAIMLGYGIARIGCQLSGDGDYGMPTSLPWGMEYSKGTVPPSVAFKDFPAIVARYGVNGVVPDTIRCHPTPLYEMLICVILFFVLWRIRMRPASDGWLFSVYLIMSGVERFLVEFIRLEPRILLGLTEAQWVSIIFIVLGLIGIRRWSKPPAAVSSA